MVKRYAFLWHVDVEVMIGSEGADGAYCDAAETEADTEEEALKKLRAWLKERTEQCKIFGCDHDGFIMSEITPQMIMGGMTNGMVKI